MERRIWEIRILFLSQALAHETEKTPDLSKRIWGTGLGALEFGHGSRARARPCKSVTEES